MSDDHYQTNKKNVQKLMCIDSYDIVSVYYAMS